jgi:pimeloyl-ACP methyl ester carboxylesterase
LLIWKRKLKKILNFNSQILKTDKGEIEYAIYGHGPIVVGIHGAPGGYDQTICLLEKIAKQGFEVIGFSRPGYLRTPLSSGKTFEMQADLLASFLDHLLVDKVSLLAISAGGPLAMHFAARHPDRINALIMEAAVSKKYRPDFFHKNKFLFNLLFNDFGLWVYHWLLYLSPKIAIKKFMSLEADLNKEDLNELVDQIIQDQQKKEFFLNLFQSFTPMSLRRYGFLNDMKQLETFNFSDYEKIICPTLIIHGKADKDVPLEHAENLSQKVKNSECFLIEKGSHLINFSNTFDKAEEKIISYLNKFD